MTKLPSSRQQRRTCAVELLTALALSAGAAAVIIVALWRDAPAASPSWSVNASLVWPDVVLVSVLAIAVPVLLALPGNPDADGAAAAMVGRR